MTLEELREMQGSFSPKRKFFWYQEYRDRDGCDRKYYNVAVCDDDHEVTAVERRVGFHHWLSGDEIIGILGADVHTCTPKQDQSIDLNYIEWYPLYLHPPKPEAEAKPARKPMTEEEMEKCFRDTTSNAMRRWVFALIRNVEEFHGIGGGE